MANEKIKEVMKEFIRGEQQKIQTFFNTEEELIKAGATSR